MDIDKITSCLTDYASGSEPLSSVAKRHGLNAQSIRKWAVEHDDVGALYARARLVSAGSLEDAALEAANASTPDTYQADRVRIDTYKWAAAKRAPKDYGDKVQVDNTISIGSLHLAALQAPTSVPRISATASLANDKHDNGLHDTEDTP